MLLSAFVFTGIGSAAQNPDVVMPMADPVIDGVIEDSGAWSEAAVFGEDTVSNFWSGNALNSEAGLYFAYSTKGLYFAADVEDNDLIYSLEYNPRPNWHRNITKPSNDLERNIWSFFLRDKVFYQDNECGEVVRNYIMTVQNG